MKLICKTLGDSKLEIEAEPSDTVRDVKVKVQALTGDKYPVDTTKLLWQGKVMEDAGTLESNGIDGQGFIVVFAPKKAKAAAAAAAPAAAPDAAAPSPEATTDTPAATETLPASSPTAPAAVDAAATEPEAPDDMDEDETSAAPASGAAAFATGPEVQASVKAIMEMGFPEDDVKHAMRAAFNNPDRAVEYLMTGLPESAAAGGAPAAADTPSATPATAAAGAPPAATVAAAAAAGAGPNAAPLDMWSADGGAAAGVGGAAPAGDGGASESTLAALQRDPQMAQQFSQILQSGDPNMLAALSQLVRSNPQLAQSMARDPASMLAMLDGMGAGGAGGDAAEMGGVVQIELTEEEAAAVGRLEALGFSRQACLQAYIACEKQEELAANYLLNSMNEED